jgi:hypothetical protein
MIPDPFRRLDTMIFRGVPFVKGSPESLAGRDLGTCSVIHRLYPQLDHACGGSGDTPCARELLDNPVRSLFMALLLCDTQCRLQ